MLPPYPCRHAKLEILSQAKDPQAVQPHLRKCFDNLVGLIFGDEPGSIDIYSMVSPEGEKVPLGKNLKARGYVEDWLSQVPIAWHHVVLLETNEETTAWRSILQRTSAYATVTLANRDTLTNILDVLTPSQP